MRPDGSGGAFSWGGPDFGPGGIEEPRCRPQGIVLTPPSSCLRSFAECLSRRVCLYGAGLYGVCLYRANWGRFAHRACTPESMVGSEPLCRRRLRGWTIRQVRKAVKLSCFASLWDVSGRFAGRSQPVLTCLSVATYKRRTSQQKCAASGVRSPASSDFDTGRRTPDARCNGWLGSAPLEPKRAAPSRSCWGSKTRPQPPCHVPDG